MSARRALFSRVGYRIVSAMTTQDKLYCIARSTRGHMRVLIGLTAILLATGCLENEETDFRVLREQGDPAVFVMEQINFYSGATNNAEILKDFDSLMQAWRSPEAVSDALVKERLAER